MIQSPDFADRVAALSLRFLAAFNVLLFLSFLLVLALATGRAHAQVPPCAGKDMISELRRTDPALLATIDAEAAGTLNGRGLLWKLEKAGEKPSHLFGTMHMTDPRGTRLTVAAQRAFDDADTVVIETTDVLDQAKMMASLAAEPELMMFTDGRTLASLLSPEHAEVLEKGLDSRGIAPGSVARMKPWMLAAMVALPACELARKAAGAPVLDVKLAQDAKAMDKSLQGLESGAEQLRAMASLPIELHMQGLVETLRLGDRIDDVMETMIVLYENEDVGIYWPLFRATVPAAVGGDDAGYAAFEEAMVTSRNRLMAERALPILAQGNAFIAVGALHLPGPDGLVELFRTSGYTVSPIN